MERPVPRKRKNKKFGKRKIFFKREHVSFRSRSNKFQPAHISNPNQYCPPRNFTACCDNQQSIGHIHNIMPHFFRCLRWTEDLHHHQVALTLQFFIGHYATNAYFCRFGSHSDSDCLWCPSTFHDQRHRLFQYPRFNFV